MSRKLLPVFLFASVTLNLLVLRFAWEDGFGPSDIVSGAQAPTAPRKLVVEAKNGASASRAQRPAVRIVAAGQVAFAPARTPPSWRNCTAVNQRYPHGVGKVGARDHTSGVPVTAFKHSNALYATAMSHNRGLDRDHDGVACEKL